MNKIKYAILALATPGCGSLLLDEGVRRDYRTSNLSRCLAPMGLNARVSAAQGDVVTFSWDGPRMEAYNFVVYTDAAGTQVYLSETVLPSQVPYQKKLEADQTYWFSVQATATGKGDSKIAFLDKSFKTFAVKDNLFLKVSGRTVNSVSLAWSTEVAGLRRGRPDRIWSARG